MILGEKKEYVCTAGNFMSIFPNKQVYLCHNLHNEKFLISDDISIMTPEEINDKLEEKAELLKISNYPKEYEKVGVFGDYCPLENNFESFAYLYRKCMVEKIQENLSKIVPGSEEHLAVIAYITKGFEGVFFDNFE